SIAGSGSDRIMRVLEASAGATTNTSAEDAAGSPRALLSTSGDRGSDATARTFFAIAGLIPVSGPAPVLRGRSRRTAADRRTRAGGPALEERSRAPIRAPRRVPTRGPACRRPA